MNFRAAIPAAALSLALFGCSKARESAPPVAAPSVPVESAQAPEVPAPANAVPATASPVPAVPAEPQPAGARNIRGYFRSRNIPESMRVWTGPGRSNGFHQLTDFVATIDGDPVYSMATDAIHLIGVCRSAGRGFDQLLLSLGAADSGRYAVIWYDAGQHGFEGEFMQEITRDPREHFGCAAGQPLLPEEAPATPCSCPWADSPGGASRIAAMTPGGPPVTGEILISAETPESESVPQKPAWGTTGAGTRPPAHIPIEVEEYAGALADLKAGKGTFETLLKAGERATKALVPLEEHMPLEELSGEDFARVEKMMEGYAVGREVSLYVDPDPKVLLALAKQHGDAADLAYFESLSESTDGIDPRYYEQTVDFGGCIKYGNLELVAAYRRWTEYARRFPGKYTDEVQEHFEGAVGQLKEGTCACDKSDSVLKELTAFVDQFPSAPIAPDVRRRIEALKAGTSNIHFECSPH